MMGWKTGVTMGSQGSLIHVASEGQPVWCDPTDDVNVASDKKVSEYTVYCVLYGAA